MTQAEPTTDHQPNDINADEIIILADGEDNHLSGQKPDRRFSIINRPELHFISAKGPRKARALVYGGGGYIDLVYDREGLDIAHWLSGMGIDAYVLIHRLPGAPSNIDGVPNPSDIALQDGLMAMDYLGQLADMPLLHVGLSSGGHLAGVMACQLHRLKAKGLMIGYAPLNANHRRYKFPKAKPDYPPVEKQDFYDAWPIGLLAEPTVSPLCRAFWPMPLRIRSSLSNTP